MTTIAGIVIPSDAPLFLAIVALHVLFALVCSITGIVAMFSIKRPGRHPTAGRIYYWCLSAVFVSASVLAILRWKDDYHLFILGAVSFIAASAGRTARRQRWRNWVTVHIAGMGLSYVFLIIAFYVDNGKNLPLWKDLPHALYWLIPGAVGMPLITWALLRHRPARHP
jgi:hypothetical protein